MNIPPEAPNEILSPRRWFAIQTRYRCERKVISQLESKGVETFLPVLEEVHRWSDRKKAVSTPLFSGYAFVHVDDSTQARTRVLRTQGVMRFVEFGGGVTAVPSMQIHHLRTLLSQKVPCALHPFLRVGQRVRVRGGSLDGLEGVLEKHSRNNLVISIDSIQRSLAIKLEGYELELI